MRAVAIKPDQNRILATVGLMDGRAAKCYVEAFTPHSLNLNISSEGDPTQRQLSVENVCYVAEHKNPDQESAAPELFDSTDLKLKVAGEKTFVVTASEATIHRPEGFYGYPKDAASPFSRIYFYPHGVYVKEDAELVGNLLVEEGHITDLELHRGISKQKESEQKPEPKPPAAVAKPQKPAPARETKSKEGARGNVLGDVLIHAGLVSAEDIASAIEKQDGKKRLGEILVEMGLIDESTLYRTLAKKFHLPFVDLDETPINQDAVAEIEGNILRKYCALPLDYNDNSILVAIGDPLATDIYDVLRFQVSKRIIEVLATPSQIKHYLNKFLVFQTPDGDITDLVKNLVLGADEEEEEEEDALKESDSAVVRLANQVILDGYGRGASDIHIEPRGKKEDTIIRFRVDGECVNYQRLPAKFWRPLVARLKIMSNLDISERRKPQDGKIALKKENVGIELRVATIPMVNDNEGVVLRILASSEPIPLKKMGLSERNFNCMQQVIKKPFGLFLCVGPTGSGKTTTLHSALAVVNREDKKIWTAEDPVEITQKGLCQVQVNPKIGFTFANAMRAFLRADPDVIMIGEMRDQETSSIAVEASLTGHLVISTLHTNSAPETVNRLLDMGLDPFTFADALLGVLAQRLVRRSCPNCKKAYIASPEEFQQLSQLYGAKELQDKYGYKNHKDLTLYESPGCSRCGNTGYLGRLAIHELLVASDELKLAVERKAAVNEVRDLALKGGMTTLVQDGIEKYIAGKTDLKQVLSVCGR